MSTPILATKLYIPRLRPNVVSRPHLLERLNEGLHRKLTLISALAGFGKTTLVSQWLASGPRPAAWLSLDEGENDPARFLTYLVAALQTIAAKIGAGVLGALQSPQLPPAKAIATAAHDVERATCLIEGDGMPLQFRGAVTAVLHWLESLPKTVLDARPALWVMYASALSMTGFLPGIEPKLQAAEAALQGAEPDDTTRNLVGHIVVIRASLAAAENQVEAVVLEAHGDKDQALHLLLDALAVAEPGGFIRTFVDEGLLMAHLLSAASALGRMPDYIGKLLVVFKAEEQKSEATSSLPLPAQSLIEPLSRREVEVLQLIRLR